MFGLGIKRAPPSQCSLLQSAEDPWTDKTVTSKEATLGFGTVGPPTASPLINQGLPHHNHFASLKPCRVCNYVQGWSAFYHFGVLVYTTSAIKLQGGGYPSSWICRASRATVPKMCVELIGQNGFASVHFRRIIQLWFVALQVRHSDSLIDDAFSSSLSN